MVKLKTDDHFFYLSYANTVEQRYLLNSGAVKVKDGYRYPKNLWTCRELYEQFPAIRAELEPIGRKLSEDVKRLIDLRQSVYTKSYHADLREYQNTDIFYLKNLIAAGIFNEQRTGKTPTTIHLLDELTCKQDLSIIVCPASLIYNWQREFEKWTPHIETTVISGAKDKRKRAYANFSKGVLIVSKDTLKMDIDVLSKFHFTVAIVDESHFLRNWKTSQSKAVYKINAKRRYALTGTPTVKHPSDIFGILHFLYPEKYPSFWQFAERYFHIEDNYMGYKEVLSEKKHRIDELQNIVGILSVQRKRRDIMQWLPDKERQMFYCQMEGKQKKAYEEMLEYFFVEETELDASGVLAQLIRLRQICLEPSLLGIDAPSAKTEALREWIAESLPTGEGVVIMSMFTSYLKKLHFILTKEGYRVGMIHGEMSNREKMDAAEQFQNKQTDILLCNIISAGTGFTLDRAETIIFTDKAWNPAENEQAEDRITPTTKDKLHKHTIISFVCQNTVDEKINALLGKKKSMTDLINDGGFEAIKNYFRNNLT